jgi:hypothetical protein
MNLHWNFAIIAEYTDHWQVYGRNAKKLYTENGDESKRVQIF